MSKLSFITELKFASAIVMCLFVQASAQALQVVDARPSSGSAVAAELFQDQAGNADSVAASKVKKRVRFSFEQADWKDVIPWFAEQAGFSLQPIADWPKGTFHLVDESEYSVIEALDQLNHALRLRTPPYTLIRNRNMLILVRADQQDYPAELIETVPVENLDQRGQYETMRCVFEFGELNCTDFDQQLRQLVSDVNQSEYSVFENANQIHVRETGATLRVMRDIIMKARQRQNAKDSTLTVYRLKHTDADSFLFVARGLLGISEESNQREDGSLSIAAEPLSDRLFVKGTRKSLEQFQQVANLLDVAPDDVTDGQPLDKPYFQSYPVTSDPALAFDSLQTFLAGRDGVRMQQDEITGAIAVMGRKADHQIVADTLAMIAGSNGTQFAIIQLKYAEPSTVILTLRSLWGQTGEIDPQGPVLLGNAAQRTVVVRGTPTEVMQVKSMIAQLDDAATRLNDGPRTNTRVIPMDDAKRDDVLGLIEDYWPSTGRTNNLRLNLIMPEDRPNLDNRFRRVPEQGERERLDYDRFDSSEDVNDGRGSIDREPIAFPDNASNWGKPSGLWCAAAQWGFQKFSASALATTAWAGARLGTGWVRMSGAAMLPTAMLVPQSLGATPAGPSPDSGSSASSSTRRADPDYVPPKQVQSVPGADIEVKATAGGVVIRSNDLDALDDMEDLIREQMGVESDVQAPTFFFLKHRYAEEVAGFLRGYFGLAGSDAGGDAGVGGVMGGMLNNVMGGGSSDLLGGLLGGDSLGGLSLLEGDVNFGTDSAFNTVYVTGATGTDLNRINEIIDILDQPNAPQDLELLGQFRTIPILHRDPEEVKQIIEVQLSDLIQGGSAGDGKENERGNAQGEQMVRLMQQMAGGGERGGSGNTSTTERPTARLGVDTKTGQLLVTGPEFIYKEVLKMVLELDKPQLSLPPTYVVIPNGGKNSELLKRNLKAIFGSKIELTDEDGEGAGSADSSSNSAGDAKPQERNANSNEQAQQEQVRRQFLRQLNRQRQGGGGGGGRNGGGQGRGGQGRGGR